MAVSRPCARARTWNLELWLVLVLVLVQPDLVPVGIHPIPSLGRRAGKNGTNVISRSISVRLEWNRKALPAGREGDMKHGAGGGGSSNANSSEMGCGCHAAWW